MKKPSQPIRKTPKQDRSRAIVDAIYEATVRILPKIGSGAVTTKKIAEMAGISVGSLYQYFPNKESVLGSVIDVVMSAEMKKVEDKIKEIEDQTMEDATNAMVDFAIELFLTEKERVREVYKRAPELGRLPALLKVRQTAVEQLAQKMKKHHPTRDLKELTRMSFVAVNSIMGVIHTILYDESQSYEKAELAKELKTMLNAYFEKGFR